MKQLTKRNRKKQNIPLRRKIAIIYTRLTIIVRILIGIFFYLIFFTGYLPYLRHEIADNIYEFTADLGFTLENVLIEGQHNTSSSDILSALNADKGTPIASIDLKKVQDNLERNRWIKTIIVERRLPSTIYIAILERIPIAIWQNNKQLFLIDDEGFVITDQHIDNFNNLLHVVGVDANIYTNKLLEDIAQHPEFSTKIVSAVRYGERRWNLNLQQDIIVKMPEAGFDQAFNYLAELYKAQKLFDQNYKIIDLRDHTKYYIEKH
ncbi:cell division protein FtsQ/DivIB [Candidatus Trichorickettsia mobilis]|uniref:cell division protein FtsQ/DivIB n=1 Tax=Candidatus Trichorickettsia mobilis TaxID=1346319 RepID=UPI002930EF99|nr:FtsQ-type POTRA domain-containing protein [Candidatus Trichorickettsia mobilis]